jgi:hypothetical protein
MAEIQRPDLVAKIRKAFEISAPDPVATLAPEIVPIVITEDLSKTDLGQTEKHCVGYGGQAATASKYSQVLLWNPAESGVDGYLDWLSMYDSSGASVWSVRFCAAIMTNAGTEWNTFLGRTGRVAPLSGVAEPPALQVVREANTVAEGTIIWQGRNDGYTERMDFPFRIAPGRGIAITLATVNHSLVGGFGWREQPARTDVP